MPFALRAIEEGRLGEHHPRPVSGGNDELHRHHGLEPGALKAQREAPDAAEQVQNLHRVFPVLCGVHGAKVCSCS